jgi:hypothetical protein
MEECLSPQTIQPSEPTTKIKSYEPEIYYYDLDGSHLSVGVQKTFVGFENVLRSTQNDNVPGHSPHTLYGNFNQVCSLLSSADIGRQDLEDDDAPSSPQVGRNYLFSFLTF